MSDPRVLAYLKRIDTKLDAVTASHRADMAEVDAEQEEQNGRLDGHDKKLANHERLIRWLCRKVERRGRR